MQSIEVAVLRTAKKQNCHHFPELIDYVLRNFFIIYIFLKRQKFREILKIGFVLLH